jgi:hypothetical protein
MSKPTPEMQKALEEMLDDLKDVMDAKRTLMLRNAKVMSALEELSADQARVEAAIKDLVKNTTIEGKKVDTFYGTTLSRRATTRLMQPEILFDMGLELIAAGVIPVPSYNAVSRAVAENRLKSAKALDYATPIKPVNEQVAGIDYTVQVKFPNWEEVRSK